MKFYLFLDILAIEYLAEKLRLAHSLQFDGG